MAKQRHQFGFSLLETLIYIALFSFILSGILAGTFYMLDSTERTRAKLLLEEEGNFLLRKITWALSGLDTIQVPASGNSGPILTVIRVGLPLGENPLTFSENGGVLQMQRGSNPTISLSSSGVSVSGLTFEHIASVVGKPAAVKINFQLNGKPFETIKYIRQ
ncbi:MAG: hypothetical protein A2847_00690 [Candidatus Sungbacteria bacterium RIFCSPHIGHO2_01_FULL_50_25]|uniref:Type II secretion system protein GspH n=1 Tax=Candidatus Sungbacteria bacterium RIFCSPHIGHO2_01_FULL_50_25 TaxID=1802265 RepID=A0A1G2KC84_9BACT|nr:MAG: hypothetical protein A2847_00690 [Candidatus Sungbacteria bacterium RIFCSPHIGHO2_01_FULL_50_25]